MTMLFILAGLAVVVMVGLFGLALCRAARMGDEAQARFIQDERLREKVEGVISLTFGNGETYDVHHNDLRRRHEDAKEWEERL